MSDKNNIGKIRIYQLTSIYFSRALHLNISEHFINDFAGLFCCRSSMYCILLHIHSKLRSQTTQKVKQWAIEWEGKLVKESRSALSGWGVSEVRRSIGMGVRLVCPLGLPREVHTEAWSYCTVTGYYENLLLWYCVHTCIKMYIDRIFRWCQI